VPVADVKDFSFTSCRADECSACGGWRQQAVDVRGLVGRRVALAVRSRAAGFFSPGALG